ncbi:MAG: cyclodeaminase/cyclohydrolase family protein [Halobacteriales archaeon]|nr:cyclodeaminase/cyclohydrolase family protein [Halobacteriales archaeon]
MSWGSLPFENVLDHLASPAPAPGGGTASALSGAMSCALSEMVLGLTLGREKFAGVEAELAPLVPQVRALRADLLRLADADSAAYEGFVRAMKLPKATQPEQAERKRAIEQAALHAAEVPLRTAQAAVEAARIAERCAKLANPNARSDAVVAALLAWSCFEGARRNVLANLPSMEPKRAEQLRAQLAPLEPEADRLLARARA